MGRLRINKIPGRGKNYEILQAADLAVVGDIDPSKLQPTHRRKFVLALRADGKNYVVDGRHATLRAQRSGEAVKVIFVTEDTQLGRQTALERLLGMLSTRRHTKF